LLGLCSPQQQRADGKDGPAGKEQYDLSGLYDTRKETVHHRTSANWRCDWHLRPIWQPAAALLTYRI